MVSHGPEHVPWRLAFTGTLRALAAVQFLDMPMKEGWMQYLLGTISLSQLPEQSREAVDEIGTYLFNLLNRFGMIHMVDDPRHGYRLSTSTPYVSFESLPADERHTLIEILLAEFGTLCKRHCEWLNREDDQDAMLDAFALVDVDKSVALLETAKAMDMTHSGAFRELVHSLLSFEQPFGILISAQKQTTIKLLLERAYVILNSLPDPLRARLKASLARDPDLLRAHFKHQMPISEPDRDQRRRNLARAFDNGHSLDNGDLKQVCFNLENGMSYENLSGDTKREKFLNLLELVYRRDLSVIQRLERSLQDVNAHCYSRFERFQSDPNQP